MKQGNPTTSRLNELAADIGRLKRRHPADHILDRVSCHVHTLALMLEPSAGQLVAVTAPGDPQAVVEALRIVDDRDRELRHLLGETQ